MNLPIHEPKPKLNGLIKLKKEPPRLIPIVLYDEIDIESWDRKEHYHFFKDFELPFFNIVGEVDATRLYEYAKDSGKSFSLCYLYYSLTVVNNISAFRNRIMDNRLVNYHTINGSSTALKKNNTFQYCYFDFKTQLDTFHEGARENIQKQLKQEGLLLSSRLDMVYYSIIPWVSFTSFQHARAVGGFDSIPRIVFGKSKKNNGRHIMPVSVEVNHALLDGVHVGQFFEEFSQIIGAL